ncbi:MAG TPA: hypothetical protein VF003_05415 [Pseudonocardiaceae bacterium]
MADALSFVEIGREHVELLPARTVLSMVGMHNRNCSGGEGEGGIGINLLNINGLLGDGDQWNNAANGNGGNGGQC